MKAVIPAAGFGTRFLPFTKSVPKELIPIVDKPVIQYVVEEAAESGIDDILIIISAGKESICQHFNPQFELEQRLDISSYSKYDKRVFGFVSERLLDVWIGTNRIEYRDMPYVFMENQNWIVKGWNFIRRKLFSASS